MKFTSRALAGARLDVVLLGGHVAARRVFVVVDLDRPLPPDLHQRVARRFLPTLVRRARQVGAAVRGPVQRDAFAEEGRGLFGLPERYVEGLDFRARVAVLAAA